MELDNNSVAISLATLALKELEKPVICTFVENICLEGLLH